MVVWHGDIDYQPTTVNLTDFCASLESHFNEVKRSDQTLDLTIDTQQDNGYFDGALMYQALVNLLNNAIKYSPDSAAISLTLQQDDNILNFILGDKGIGISRNDITNIYQPFFRGKNAENERGTGLGLAIVRDIVDLHHEMPVSVPLNVPSPDATPPEFAPMRIASHLG